MGGVIGTYSYTDFQEYPTGSSLVPGRTIADNFNRKEINAAGAIQGYDVQFLGTGQISTVSNAYLLVRSDINNTNFAGLSALNNTVNVNPNFAESEIDGLVWKTKFRLTAFEGCKAWQLLDILEGVVFAINEGSPQLGIGYDPEISPNYIIRVSGIDTEENFDTGIPPLQDQEINCEITWNQDGTVSVFFENLTTEQTIEHTFGVQLLIPDVNALTWKAFTQSSDTTPAVLNIYNWSVLGL